MQQNIGRIDQVLRGVMGIWLLMVALSALQPGQKTRSMIAGIAGIGLLQNATTGFCGVTQLFGVDTIREQSNVL